MKNLSKTQTDRLTTFVGAYIKYVRDNHKAPSVSSLYKKLFNVAMNPHTAILVRKTLEECVAHVDSKGARLYRDNRTAEEIMPSFLSYYDKFRSGKNSSVEDLSKLSDKDLQMLVNKYSKELSRREEKQRKQERLSTILSVAECSVEDLLALINDCK